MEGFEEEIITLTSSEGDIDFHLVADIALDDDDYVILQPVELFEGMEEDEALVFRIYENEDGEPRYELVQDEGLIDEVFAVYNDYLDDDDDED